MDSFHCVLQHRTDTNLLSKPNRGLIRWSFTSLASIPVAKPGSRILFSVSCVQNLLLRFAWVLQQILQGSLSSSFSSVRPTTAAALVCFSGYRNWAAIL
ncbi:hypothetical protein MRB53_023158 [Persea americana]|uniref:Uncharacterized protein n=1 Tax=Persea americana TaxID=3435 RepID=A0ACC2L8S1_PERAE|nr:hypothetical protein MRB53_023158 [Persea americana]